MHYCSKVYLSTQSYSHNSIANKIQKECQKIAWADHHQAECKVLAKIDQRNSTGYQPPVLAHENSPVWNENLRCMLRLLLLHKKNKITADEWAEIQGFRDRAMLAIKHPKFIADVVGKGGLVR